MVNEYKERFMNGDAQNNSPFCAGTDDSGFRSAYKYGNSPLPTGFQKAGANSLIKSVYMRNTQASYQIRTLLNETKLTLSQIKAKISYLVDGLQIAPNAKKRIKRILDDPLTTKEEVEFEIDEMLKKITY